MWDPFLNLHKRYHDLGEPIADRLFAFPIQNKDAIIDPFSLFSINEGHKVVGAQPLKSFQGLLLGIQGGG